MRTALKHRFTLVSILAVFTVLAFTAPASAMDKDVKKALEIQKALKDLIKKVKPAYVFFGRGGSAVCISPDGYVLTNYHVAGRCERAGSVFSQFYFTGGKKYSGVIVWYDPAGDIALCKLDLKEGETVPFVKLGESDDLVVGEHAIAVGNPFSLGMNNWDPSVTLGVIAANRRYKGWYSEAVQTDASINPGNSGGPLFNMKGEVVGINGMIEIDRARGKLNCGVGYAVPASQIKRFMKFYDGKFTKGGKVTHGAVKGLTVDLVPIGRQGAKVKGVKKDTTAEKAGFKVGDIITTFEGKAVVHPRHFQAAVHTFPKGYEVTVTIEREGEAIDLKVTLDAFVSKRRYPGTPRTPRTPRSRGGFFGVGSEPAEGGGIRVTQVVPDSGADKAGIKIDDIILKIGGRTLNSPDMFRSYLGGRKPGDKVKVVVKRGDKELNIVVTLGTRS